MNDKFGTTKLLALSGQVAATKAVLGGSVAVRIGAQSSGIALVDSTDAEKLIIFQITYTERSHREMCLNFLASGEDKDQIRRVFVDRLVPEFTERLPEFIDKTRTVNYADQVKKSARLLFHLSESFDDFLYPPTLTDDQLSDICALVDSSDSGTRITTVARQGAEKPTTKRLAGETHNILTETRQSLVNLLLGEAVTQEESADCQLSHLLHNMPPLSEKPETFQRAFTECVQPALNAYTEAIKTEIASSGAGPGAVFICDSLFSSEFCRQSVARDLAECGTACKTLVRFVSDPGLLGFLGALLVDDEEGTS